MSLLRITLGVSGVLFVALAVLSKGWLEPGGALIFDSRVAGYDGAEARAYFTSLEPRAVDLYLGLFRVLDTFFPIFLTLAILLLARRTQGPIGLAAIPAALAYLFFDLRENALVAEMLRAGKEMSDALVVSASGATLMKWVTLGTSGLLLALAHFMSRKERAGA